jgi:hypothetical protein
LSGVCAGAGTELMKHRMTDEPFHIFGGWSIHDRPLWENAVCALTKNIDLYGVLSCKGYTQRWLRAVRLAAKKGSASMCANLRHIDLMAGMDAQTLRDDFAQVGVTQRRLASELSYLCHRAYGFRSRGRHVGRFSPSQGMSDREKSASWVLSFKYRDLELAGSGWYSGETDAQPPGLRAFAAYPHNAGSFSAGDRPGDFP